MQTHAPSLDFSKQGDPHLEPQAPAPRPDGGGVASVQDDGAGIPIADRTRMLKRFVRIETGRSTPGNVLGLNRLDTWRWAGARRCCAGIGCYNNAAPATAGLKGRARV